MSEEKPRLARLTAIVTQLQSKRLITARDIADKHNVSIRTVYRDIRTLEKSGIPIFTEEGKGYSIQEGYRLPPVMFTQEEANALITAEQIIAKNKDKSLTDHYGSAIEKIKSVLKHVQKSKTELLSERLQIRENIRNEQTSNYLIQLQTAITNYQLVSIAYRDLHGESTERDIEPFALYHTHGNWILIAFCRLRTGFRAFRLDRMQVFSITNKRFDPHTITLQDYFKEARKKWANTLDIPLTPCPSTFASNQKNNNMQKVNIEPFKVIGISVRTSNGHGNAAQDIGQLWSKFMSEGILAQIPDKIDDRVFSIYTNYLSDYTEAYDTVLGCEVHTLDNIPEGMVGHSFDGGAYSKFTYAGDMTKGLVVNAWSEIWATDLDRAYTADFELYDQRAKDPTNAELDIFIATKE